jgi:hypothetical protein
MQFKRGRYFFPQIEQLGVNARMNGRRRYWRPAKVREMLAHLITKTRCRIRPTPFD